MNTRQEISERTGFDHGQKFETASDVQAYFTIPTMDAMVGRENWNPADVYTECEMIDMFGHTEKPLTQSDLNAIAEQVINNRWHCTF